MARIRIQGAGSHKLKPRTVISLIILLVVVIAAYLNRETIILVIDAMMQGALIPLIVACLLECARIVFHSCAYSYSFRVIGYRLGLDCCIPAWFKAVFMNTILPSGGTSGLASVVDSARRRGVPVGSATTATLFTQTCFYVTMFLVILLGFWIMAGSGVLTMRDVAVGLLMGVAAVVLVALLLGGLLAPGKLQQGLRWIERRVVRLAKAIPFIKKEPAPWADNLVSSYSAASAALVRNPRRAVMVFFSMVVAMIFDTLAFIASGYAFGIERIDALFGAYITALVFNSFNVTPGGAGVVEGLAAAVLVGYGYPLTQALSVILVYRAFVYWIPLVVGGVMMQLTGAFGATQVPVQVQDSSHLADTESTRIPWRLRLTTYLRSYVGIRVFVVAGLMIASAITGFVSSLLGPDEFLYDIVANFVIGWHPIPAVFMSVNAALVCICVPGIFKRDSSNWLVSIVMLLGLAFSSVLAAHGTSTVVLSLLSLVCLALWNKIFDSRFYLDLVVRLRFGRNTQKEEDQHQSDTVVSEEVVSDSGDAAPECAGEPN